jgi:hypothetical protein
MAQRHEPPRRDQQPTVSGHVPRWTEAPRFTDPCGDRHPSRHHDRDKRYDDTYESPPHTIQGNLNSRRGIRADDAGVDHPREENFIESVPLLDRGERAQANMPPEHDDRNVADAVAPGRAGVVTKAIVRRSVGFGARENLSARRADEWL